MYRCLAMGFSLVGLGGFPKSLHDPPEDREQRPGQPPASAGVSRWRRAQINSAGLTRKCPASLRICALLGSRVPRRIMDAALLLPNTRPTSEIGRASCRERV